MKSYGKCRLQRIALIILTLIVVGETSELFRLHSIVEHAHLARYAFRVIDAKSQDLLPNFTVTFPARSSMDKNAFPRELSLLRGRDFSLFMSVATEPVTIIIGEPGYEDVPILVDPRRYEGCTGALAGDLQTVALTKSGPTR
jgi:hypothetical protein